MEATGAHYGAVYARLCRGYGSISLQTDPAMLGFGLKSSFSGGDAAA
jgi:hypothetical protein